MKRIFKVTEDGSHTLYIPELDEHYHSKFGAIQEAVHVYINAGLNLCNKNKINVLEAGFGTGLNTFLTFIESEKQEKEIDYTSIELYPLEKEITDNLNFSEALNYEDSNIFKSMHDAVWNESTQISSNFKLNKVQADLTTYDFKGPYDVVYYDAFAPEVQPELWDVNIFKKIYDAMNSGGILTTYCVKGIVKRALTECGFKIKRLPGPPGKREMLRAIKTEI
jgi:tRNA U34 5-methylaminomethyl-2-thiouridine-forming methyltransferase MnmC